MRLMRWPRRYLWVVCLLIAVSASYYGIVQWKVWNDYSRSVIWQNWRVDLPRGGSVTYRNQSPRMRLAGPADTEKSLIWVKPDGKSQEYPISSIGGGYNDVEFRSRQDGRTVWLISWNWNKIVATLDLDNGRFTGEGGAVYDRSGQQNESAQHGHPKWAKMNGGRSLARRKFQGTSP